MHCRRRKMCLKCHLSCEIRCAAYRTKHVEFSMSPRITVRFLTTRTIHQNCRFLQKLSAHPVCVRNCALYTKQHFSQTVPCLKISLKVSNGNCGITFFLNGKKWNFFHEGPIGEDSGFMWHKIVCISKFLWTWCCTIRFDVNSESVCCIW
jgi:hypothetical protein